MTENNHATDSGEVAQSIKYERYRFDVACKKCGVIDSVTLPHDQASVSPMPIDDDPAKNHYERTGHTVARLCYTKSPADVREMLDAGNPDDLDWERIGVWLSND